jgi:release factor glutamine methyltransferase
MVFTSPLALLKQIKDEIEPIYGGESDSIAMLLAEYLTGLERTAIIMDSHVQTGPQFRSQLSKAIRRLVSHEPIQYITGEAHFYNHKFQVNHATLIPRPETEELVARILLESDRSVPLRILDIGTGSGCIAISLTLALPLGIVDALDVSANALQVAKQNALDLGATVEFFELNILDQSLDKQYDVIVSNPPYVRNMEKSELKNNVLDFEPAIALFVPDNNPLVFYERIISMAFKNLNSEGRLYLEINELFGSEIANLLTGAGFINVTITPDMQHKDRFAQGIKPKD